jgi:hypothetical protein
MCRVLCDVYLLKILFSMPMLSDLIQSKMVSSALWARKND